MSKMLVLYICIALAVTKSTVCGQAVSEDEVDITDQKGLNRRQLDTPRGCIGYMKCRRDNEQCKRENDQYQSEIEQYKKELAMLKDNIHGLQKGLQDKVEVAVEEGLDPVQDCADILRLNPEARSGLHNINIHRAGGQTERFLVYCDMETDGGGWMVIQRRQSDAVNFNRDFDTYREGFGIMTNDFWLGNENIHLVTSRWNYELRIDLENFEGEKRYAKYGMFKLECGGYRMSVDFYSGDAGDALEENNGMLFSTHDQDSDMDNDMNCAVHHQGPWWHNACTRANLNGIYRTCPSIDTHSIFWYDWQGHTTLKTTEMMIRPAAIQHSPIIQDCAAILWNNPQAPSGEYTVYMTENNCIIGSMQLYCDMDTDGGGWTVFQRRQDGSVDFFRNYQSYREGFGDVNGEFWLGNDNLHQLTSGCDQELRFDLMDENNDTRYAHYASFRVGSYDDGYRMDVSTYSGTAGDAFTSHDGMMFSTYDRNQDPSAGNCAETWEAAWWYFTCLFSNLNGRYYTQSPPIWGVGWMHWTGSGSHQHLRFTEMKIRPSGSCN